MKKFIFLIILMVLILSNFNFITAQERVRIPIPRINIDVEEATSPKDISLSLQIIFLLSILSLAPSIIILLTAFLRIAIVFDFIKRALSLQQMPPNQVMFGLALFLTFFIMWPTFNKINQEAIQPFINQERLPAEQRISVDQFFERSINPLRDFMFRQTDPAYIGFFMNMRELPAPNDYNDVPTYILIPAFIVNELTVGFKIGMWLFLPFIVIDMIVASVLMAMGMIMLPPVMISLPFKIILFVLVDGWEILIYHLFRSFA